MIKLVSSKKAINRIEAKRNKSEFPVGWVVVRLISVVGLDLGLADPTPLFQGIECFVGQNQTHVKLFRFHQNDV